MPSPSGARRFRMKYRAMPCIMSTAAMMRTIVSASIAVVYYSAMTLHEKLKTEIPDALRARDEVRLRTLRSLVAAMTNDVVAKKRKPDEYLNDDEAIAVLRRAANQRRDSIEQFEKGGRPELAVPEKQELALIETYLPQMMRREEIAGAARIKMVEMKVEGKADAGKFMGALMKELKGRADGGDVKAVVDSLLS